VRPVETICPLKHWIAYRRRRASKTDDTGAARAVVGISYSSVVDGRRSAGVREVTVEGEHGSGRDQRQPLNLITIT